jgi:hypothetical protein
VPAFFDDVAVKIAAAEARWQVRRITANANLTSMHMARQRQRGPRIQAGKDVRLVHHEN